MELTSEFAYAIRKGHLDFVKKELANIDDIDYIDESGYSFLAYAVLANNLEIVKLLLETNANVNIQDKVDGKTCLHYCSRNGYLDITKHLLIRGANVSIQDDFGNEPLMGAVYKGTLKSSDSIINELLEIIKLFLTHGSNRNNANYKGVSPFDLAKEVDYKPLIDVLENN